MRGYEGDYNSASAESSSDGELDTDKFYRRRASADLKHVYHTYRGPRPTKETRRRTTPMDHSAASGEDAHERYLAEVEIIDLRSGTDKPEVSYLETDLGFPESVLDFDLNSWNIHDSVSDVLLVCWEECHQITARKPTLIETLL